MSLNWISKASLRLRLIAILMPVMVVFAVTNLVFSKDDTIQSINAAYDRTLLGVIKTIDLNVSTSSGGLSAELPYPLFELFHLTASGNVFFRIATTDGLVELGNHDLPQPSTPIAPGRTAFYDAQYMGESVRVGVYLRKLDPNNSSTQTPHLMIQVAESTQSRESFAASLTRKSLWRDGLLMVLVASSLAIGLIFALKPLLSLAAQTRERDASDLSPLPTDKLPSELMPLVAAVNHQIQRTVTLMEERRSFIDDASHQLRTPLSILRTQLDFALRQTDPAAQAEALSAVSAELGFAIRATNQLLALAHNDTAIVSMHSFNLSELVRQVALNLLPLAKDRNIDLGVEIAQEILPVNGDSHMIRQALMNIVHNAIEHGRAGGVVTITADANGNNHPSIKVVDDGPGIPAEIAPLVGLRFVKGKYSRGSGLGLSIARSVMQSHGGRLEVISPITDQGTEVRLVWPSI